MRWRIRHKLTFGLFLVVGIMALLSAGMLEGLRSYRSTMGTMDVKLSELRAVQDVHAALRELDSLLIHEDAGRLMNDNDLEQKIQKVQNALTVYQERVASSQSAGSDFGGGANEAALVEGLARNLKGLPAIRAKTSKPVMYTIGDKSPKSEFDEPLQKIHRQVADLSEHIHTDLNQRIAASYREYAYSRNLVYITGVGGLLFLIGLARLTYRWIADPIKHLHENVAKVAQGDFDSRIELKSGDELQELGDAFNIMTERLHMTYRDLERQVNERSRQLIRSEKLAGVGFLAAGVAHEINNPLASIAFCGESLERRIADLVAGRQQKGDAETIVNYLKMIQQEAFRCKEITGRLLEFSRVGEYQRQSTDLAELIQSVLDMVQHLQSHRDKEILFDSRIRPRLSINAQEIKSVVLNLVVNALENMDAGGRLTIILNTRDGMAVMTFADTGCGMTQEILDNIFEPFFTRSRTGKGTGLGLSISHRIINQHGGEIEGTSAGTNQGSTFTVRLPLVQANEHEPPILKMAA